MIYIRAIALTHVGNVRGENQDNLYFQRDIIENESTLKNQHEMIFQAQILSDVVAIFDGMGGEKSGSEASSIAAETLQNFHSKQETELLNEEGILKFILDYIKVANRNICDFMKTIQGRSGSTVAMLVVADGKAISANLGDSRIYLYRNHKLSVLSEDHTEMQLALKAGIDFRRGKGKLVQHLGIFDDELVIEPHVRILDLEPFDRFILCSDGVTDMVTEEIIEGYCQLDLPVQTLANTLLNLSLDNGGKDNISIIVYDVIEISKGGVV